jgi:hypothetical protein
MQFLRAGSFPKKLAQSNMQTHVAGCAQEPGINGCVPLSTGEPELLTLSINNTQISGVCTDMSIAAAEAQQQWHKHLLAQMHMQQGSITWYKTYSTEHQGSAD